MRLCLFFSLFAAAPFLVLGDGSQPAAPQLNIGNGQISWALPDIPASRGFDFFNGEKTCSAPSKLRKRVDPNDVASLTSEGIAFMQQAGDDGALANIFYEMAVEVQQLTIPALTVDAQNQAMANLIAWASSGLPVEIYYVDVAVIPTFALLTLSSLIISCFNTKRQADTLQKFNVQTSNDDFDFTKFCPKDDLTPVCDNIMCQGTNGKCGEGLMNGCQCTTPQYCPTLDIRPICSNCGGADPQTGLCQGVTGPTGTTGIYKGCECYPDVDPVYYQPWTNEADLDAAEKQAQAILKGGGNSGANPKCYGTDSTTYTLQPDFTDAIKTFCNDPSNIKGNQDTTTRVKVTDRVQLAIEWPMKSGGDTSPWYIDPGTCQKNLAIPINGCDGNDPVHNPSNLKHGGEYTDEDKIVYIAKPLTNDAFEKACTGWQGGSKAFMSASNLRSDILDVCSHAAQFARGGNEGSYSQTYDSNTDDAAFLKVSWAKGTTLSDTDCIAQMDELRVGCDGDAVLNQFDFKFGGLKAGLNVLYEVHPLTSRMPITSGSNSGQNLGRRENGTTGENGKTIIPAVLQMCLAGYKYQGWDGFDCAGMVSFYKGHYTSWNSPQDCHNGCVNQLSEMIDQGVSKGYCNNCVNGVAVCCWEGYEF